MALSSQRTPGDQIIYGFVEPTVPMRGAAIAAPRRAYLWRDRAPRAKCAR